MRRLALDQGDARETVMRNLLIGIAAAGAVLTSFPASAQFGFRVDDRGVRVRIGEPEWYGGPRYVEEEVIEQRPRCRLVEEERVRRNGTVVTRRVRRCD
jgi:hypothetical protein